MMLKTYRRWLLKAHSDEVQASSGYRLEVGQQVGVPASSQIGMKDRVKRNLFGDEVECLQPDLLLLARTTRLRSLVQKAHQLC